MRGDFLFRRSSRVFGSFAGGGSAVVILSPGIAPPTARKAAAGVEVAMNAASSGLASAPAARLCGALQRLLIDLGAQIARPSHTNKEGAGNRSERLRISFGGGCVSGPDYPEPAYCP